MSIKFLVLGGGYFGFGGGGKCRFYFYGPGDFSDSLRREMPVKHMENDVRARRILIAICMR